MLSVALVFRNARDAGAQTPARAATPHGAILVRVADVNDQPLWGGDVDLPVLDVHFPVPDGGMLLIKDVPPGMYLIQAKRIGYGLQRRFVKVGLDTARVQFTLSSGAMLDTVKVTGFTEAWGQDFARHKKQGFGSFYTASDIDAAGEVRLSSFLRRSRGLVVVPGAPDIVHSMRASGRCGMMQVYWDGMLMNAPESSAGVVASTTDAKMSDAKASDGPWVPVPFGNGPAFDINTIPLGSIGAIEVFTDAGTVPPLYANGRGECGAVLIWSK